MKLIKDNALNYYVDQDLFDHIHQIWVNYNIEIPDNSNLLFGKNVTVPRLVTDYLNKNIRRVIKPEKATHLVINYFKVSNFPKYYDASKNVVTDDDNFEPVYSLNGLYPEHIDTVKQILHFQLTGQKIDYVNQDVLNKTLNNGFIIDNDNYTVIKELIDSESSDNHRLAATMIINSDLEKNFDWILYLYHGKYYRLADNDTKKTVESFFKSTKNLGIYSLFGNFDLSFTTMTNEDVKEKMLQMKRAQFASLVSGFLYDSLGTKLLTVNDFQLNLK